MSVLRAVVITLAILTVPVIAMLFTSDVQWAAGDFVIAGTLVFITSFIIDLILHRVDSSRRKLIGVAIVALVFLLLWAELAVGVFTGIGS